MKQPDGPKAPALLQTLRSMRRPLETLEESAHRYGDIFTSRVPGFAPMVVVSGPEALQQLYAADGHFECGQNNNTLVPLLGEHALVRQDGEQHQRRRKLLTPPFHGERMRAYGQIIFETADQVIDQWVAGATFVVRPAMQEISLRVILRAVFGVDEAARSQLLRERLEDWLSLFDSPLRASMLLFPFLQRDLGLRSPWGRFLHQRAQIDALIYSEIARRQVDPSALGEDILSLMMAVRDEAGEPLADVELRDELMNLLFGGHETTASALAWALYWVARTPEVKDRLVTELDCLGPDADPTAIAKLPYLTAVCQETLRIYPVLMFSFGRRVKSPFELMGYYIEPGTVLMPCIYLTHHRADLYPEPKQFRPERFLERQYSPYEYLPFGGGTRRCLGVAFAQYELKLVLARILKRFTLEQLDSEPLKPVSRIFTSGPPGGFSLRAVEDRRAAKRV